MTAPNRNTAWARAFADELARCGVEHVCVAPGSRSTPLVLAFWRHDGFRVHAHVDERSAAFFALGIGKTTRRPAAVVTTSGTATANLFPAVVEAGQSEAPLLLLTADRPLRVRGTDANQTVDQADLYGDHVRMFADVSAPRMTRHSFRYLRSLAARAAAAARGLPAGPVHLNFPFGKPLEPTPVPGDLPEAWDEEVPVAVEGRPSGAPYTRVSPRALRHRPEDADRLAGLLDAPRGLIVAGPAAEPDRSGPAALELAEATGYPVLADPLSGARFGPGAPDHAVPAYDLLLREPQAREALDPEVVLRVGASPTSRALLDFLQEGTGVQAVVDAGERRWKDHLAVANEYVRADPAALCREVAARVDAASSGPWREAWYRAGRAAQEAAAAELEAEFFEGTAVAAAVDSLDADATLVVGSSMPVRDLDAYAPPREAPIRVLGNRGASGIDGLVSLALGAAAASPGPVLCVLGDLSLYHDMNGLLAARRGGAAVTFLVVNNDGGGIFHLLPVREHDPPFTELFATPHGLDFRQVAGLYGLPYAEAASRGEIAAALDAGAEPEGSRLVEVKSDREQNRRRHEEAEAAVREAVREAL